MPNIFNFFIDFLCIIDNKITSVGILVAIGTLLLTLKGYKEKETEKKENMKQIKKSTLEGILKELDFLGQWFRTPYSNDFKGSGWSPYDMVFRTEGAEYTKFAVDPKYTFLYDNNFLNTLIIFNQLNTNFKQLIERDLIYSNSDPDLANKSYKLLDRLKGEDKTNFIENIERKNKCKKSLDNEEIFLIVKQKLIRAVHINGIGDKNNPNSLHSIFCKLEELTKKELESLKIDDRFKLSKSFNSIEYFSKILYVLIIIIFISIFYIK